MIDILGHPSPAMPGAMALGLSIALKATLLMLAALAVHRLLGRRRVLVRSVTWNACLLGLLLLPVSAATFPRLLLEAPRGPTPTAAVVRPLSELVAAVEPSRPIPAPAPIVARGRDRFAAAFLAYVAVAAGLAARLLLSLLAVERLRRSSPEVREQPWVEALGRWRGRLGLTRRVGLARSQRLGVPVVVGWLRPVILLPDTLVDSAAIATIDAVLLHELSHVRRGDYAWNVLLRLVQVIYWPHPLIWLIGRFIADVREQACDELCVSWLGGSANYAETLLAVTAGLIRRPWETLGLAMTRSTKLGRRLARIGQSAGASRCLLRAPARGAIVVAVLSTFGLLGSVTLVRPRAGESKPPDRRERGERGAIRRTTAQAGTLHAFESADLYARVPGYLKEQNVDIGDRVKQGELLAVIDAPEVIKDAERADDVVEQARLAVAQAEARVKTAENEAKATEAAVAQSEAEVERHSSARKFREKETARYKELRERNAVSEAIVTEQESHLDTAIADERAAKAGVIKAQADVDSARSRVDQARTDLRQAKSGVRLAETNLDRARIMVGYTRIVSPFDGTVTRRGFHPGAFVRAPDAGTNVPLFTVSRTDKMRVVTHIPDRDVPHLHRGNPAVIRLDALPGQTFRGMVARFAETEDPASRTMRTEIDLDNGDQQLREGMYGLVTIELDD